MAGTSTLPVCSSCAAQQAGARQTPVVSRPQISCLPFRKPFCGSRASLVQQTRTPQRICSQVVARAGGAGGPREDSEFQERVVQVSRVTKVVKGGKQLAFRYCLCFLLVLNTVSRVACGLKSLLCTRVQLQLSIVTKLLKGGNSLPPTCSATDAGQGRILNMQSCVHRQWQHIQAFRYLLSATLLHSWPAGWQLYWQRCAVKVQLSWASYNCFCLCCAHTC